MSQHLRSSVRPFISFRKIRPLLHVMVCCLALLMAGCQGHFAAQNVPRMNWLIMPFQQPSTMSSEIRDIRGWWFGARTVHQSPRAGELMSEALTRSMAELEYVNLFPTIGLKDYFAAKRDALKAHYPYLSDEEIKVAINGVSPLDFAHQLNADKVLTGRIVQQYMADNRTIHWWWSVIEADCEVLDVATGKSEWKKHYSIRKQFSSMPELQEKLSAQAVKDLQATYFRPLAQRPRS